MPFSPYPQFKVDIFEFSIGKSSQKTICCIMPIFLLKSSSVIRIIFVSSIGNTFKKNLTLEMSVIRNLFINLHFAFYAALMYEVH